MHSLSRNVSFFSFLKTFRIIFKVRNARCRSTNNLLLPSSVGLCANSIYAGNWNAEFELCSTNKLHVNSIGADNKNFKFTPSVCMKYNIGICYFELNVICFHLPKQLVWAVELYINFIWKIVLFECNISSKKKRFNCNSK